MISRSIGPKRTQRVQAYQRQLAPDLKAEMKVFTSHYMKTSTGWLTLQGYLHIFQRFFNKPRAQPYSGFYGGQNYFVTLKFFLNMEIINQECIFQS